MENIKIILKIMVTLVAFTAMLVILYKLQDPRIYKLDTNILKDVDKSDSIYTEEVEIFVIQNPPSQDTDLVNLINHFNDSIDIKKVPSPYGQSFYKETIRMNRFTKPYKDWTGNEYNVLYGNFPNRHINHLQYIIKPNKERVNDSLKNEIPTFIFHTKNGTFYFCPNDNYINKSSSLNYNPFKEYRKGVFEE